MMQRSTVAYLLAGVMLNAAAQLSLKGATNRLGPLTLALDTLWPTGLRVALQPLIWIGVLCYAVSIVVWIVTLSRVDVSLAYPFLSLGYVVNALAAYYFFGENLSIQRCLAIGFILIGVYLLARS